MLSGLYSSYAGMEAMLLKQDVVANNLANASSVGFKQDFTVIQAYPPQALVRLEGSQTGSQRTVLGPVGDSSGGALVGDIFTDYSQGSVEDTGIATDLALDGDGYFAVSRAGTTCYTRAGDFRLDLDGRLVTADGYAVLGENGQPLNLAGKEISFSSDGTVTVDGEARGRLMLVAFPAGTRLDKTGEGLFTTAAAGARPEQGGVMQGYLEASNVNSVKQMVDMMAGFRVYESNQRIIRALDSTLERAVNQVGKA